MTTLRLVKPSEPAPQAQAQAPDAPASPAPAVPAEPPASRDVRVRFDSLPMTMRAVVHEQPDDRLLIEAQLPWLAIGTVVHAGAAEEMEHTGRVEFFDLGVTSAGSARLRIFADLTPAGSQPRAAARRQTQRMPRRRPRVLVTAFFVVAAAAAGYLIGRGSLTASLFDSAAAEVTPGD
jgi:hypothetical protein